MNLCEGTPTWRNALKFFFRDYLPRHRGLSRNTQESYAIALRMLTKRVETRSRGPHQLEVRQVFAFLDHLEQQRVNCPHTRNVRLAALKCFWKAMMLWDPAHQSQYEHLSRIPFKRFSRRSPDYLERDELWALFETVDPSTHQGFRDLTLLRYFYNTGSRISETANARTSWLTLTDSPEVIIHGKGGRWRVCPLLPTTVEMLRIYLRQERPQPRKGHEDFLFLTRRRTGFGRAGLWKLLHGYFQRAANSVPGLRRKHLTPHSLRHSTAVHLLRAGVEINVIKAWLGHSDVSTTSQYLDLDLDKKREALEQFLKLDMERLTAGVKGATEPLPQHVLGWLEQL